MRAAAVVLIPVLAGAMWAQGSRPAFGKNFSWWESPLAADLNLSDDQVKQIRATVSQYRGRLSDLRGAVGRAEQEVQNAFNEETVDQKRAGDAIEQLVTARGELFRATSQMDLKLRAILTAEQWQDLQARQRGGARPVRRRLPGGGLKNAPVPLQTGTKAAPPAASSALQK